MYDCLVIGGGVIGLSIARQFALAGKKTALLEAKETIGTETSFRNSAVIHAGIYYPSDSLKAKLCIQGRSLLLDYCKRKAIPNKKIGKLIIAKDQGQLEKLKTLAEQAQTNGVIDLAFLNESELINLEPAIQGKAALFSRSTAIVNGQLLLKSLKNDFQLAGGSLYTKTIAIEIDAEGPNFKIITSNPHHPKLRAKTLINAAGIWAHEIAENIKGLDPATIPPLFLAKGNYFKYLDPAPFKHLIYPLPESAGLGIHATIDMEGYVRFGPDVEWVETVDYRTNVNRKQIFVDAIKQYFPTLNELELVPDDAHTGIRPKIKPPEEQPQDFLIQTRAEHGIPRLVNLYGIESPGLTSAFAIAKNIYHHLHLFG